MGDPNKLDPDKYDKKGLDSPIPKPVEGDKKNPNNPKSE